MGMVAHYTRWNEETKTSKLVSCLLKLEEMDSDVSKTADVIHDHIISVLNEFDLQNNTNRIVFISDHGKNVMNACDGYTRNSCIDHFINNVVCEMTKEIEETRSIVARVRRCSY